MALTHRTARFGVARSAQLLAVKPRAALRYAPDAVAGWIADELAGVAPGEDAAPGVVVHLAKWRNGHNMPLRHLLAPN